MSFFGASVKGGDTMTLNILFLTITVKKNKKTREAYLQEERVHELYQAHHDRFIMQRNY